MSNTPKREEVVIFVEKLRDDIQLPIYAHEGDSGMDVYASEDIVIYPQETKIVPTGLKVAIPDGYEIQVRARSGISLKTPIRISNGVGTVDSPYKNEVGIIITNTSINGDSNDEYDLTERHNAHGIYYIKKGDRVAQFVLQRVPKMVLEVVESVSGIGNDRNGGYGASGVR